MLALALLAQTILWAVVHFTDIRVQELPPPAPDASSLKVIVHDGPGAAPAQPTAGPAGKSLAPPEAIVRTKAAASKPGPGADAALAPGGAKNINLVPTGNDIRLRRAAGLIQAVGVIAAILLALLVVAGGSAVPGVEHAVTACMWTLVIAFVTIPLGSILPGITYSGVFAPYDSIVRDSDAYRSGVDSAPGGIAFFGLHMGVPMLLITAVGACVLRFRAGIEQGVIITSVSQLDERIEQEIRSRTLGELSRPRAIAALNQAIGAAPAPIPNAGPTSGPLRQPPARSPGMMPPRAANPLGASLGQAPAPVAPAPAPRPIATPAPGDGPGSSRRPI